PFAGLVLVAGNSLGMQPGELAGIVGLREPHRTWRIFGIRSALEELPRDGHVAFRQELLSLGNVARPLCGKRRPATPRVLGGIVGRLRRLADSAGPIGG